MTSTIEEDFELELRSLPGVLSVGLNHDDGGEVDAVMLLARGQDPDALRDVALQVASLYYPEALVTVEDANGAPSARGDRAARVALVWSEFNEHDGISQVQLNVAGRIGIGRSGSGPLIGGAEATLSALRDLGCGIPFYLMEATKVDTVTGWSVVVTFRSLTGMDDRMGIAQADTDLVAAAKATLNALNRYVNMDPYR
jgi:hypothetical protein